MKRLIVILAVIILSVSSVNKAEAKRKVLRWLWQEQYKEEKIWCGIWYDSEVVVDEKEVELLACLIYCEAGADSISDDTRRMVGDVALNRVQDMRFPDTLEKVLTQKSQYGCFYWTGIVWPSRANSDAEKDAVDRAYRIAQDLLTGTHSDLYGKGYIYLAEFRQG